MKTENGYSRLSRRAVRPGFSTAIALLIAAIIVCLASARTVAQTPEISSEPSAVLILNSYHKGFLWTDEVVRGIEDTLAASSRKIELWVEYMDTKRHPDGMHRNLLFASYRHRFQNRKFDLILTSDNNALDFALEHRGELFPGTPIVFCGINHFEPEMIAGREAITGVAENADVRGTVETALKLQSKARKAIVIIADTATGRDNEKRVQNITPIFPDLSFTYWRGRLLEDMQSDVANLPPDTFLIQFGVARTRDGRTALNDEVVNRLSTVSSVPIYSDTDFTLGHGILGGRLLSGYIQGKTAAAMGLEVLGGRPASEIPVLTESPNRDMFDYRMMERFGISISQLPPGSIVINEPEPISQEFRNFIIGSVVIGSILAALVAFLVLNVIRRKSAERALRTSEARLAALIEHSPAGIHLKDLAGRYIVANEHYRSRFGLTAEAIVGRTSKEVLPADAAADAMESDAKVIAQKTVIRFERSLKCADGKTRDLMVIKFPVFDADGNLSGLGSVSTDISDVKQANEAARALQAELAHVSRLSTMGEMAAGFAHELNQPLAAISNFARGCVRRLKMPDTDPTKILGALEEISEQAHRASGIIERIRGFVGKKDGARAAEGNLPIDINAAIRSAAGLLTSDTLKHGVMLRMNLAPVLPLVRADAIQIQQVVVNLARNSMEAMSGAQSSPRNLTIRTFCGGSDTVTIEVLDTGPGISEDVLPKLFNPFFTTKATGMGMGLSICRSIIEQHGGELHATNRSRGGAAFQVTLTAAEQETAAA